MLLEFIILKCLIVIKAITKNGIVDNIILKLKLIKPIININPNKIPKLPMLIKVNILLGFF